MHNALTIIAGVLNVVGFIPYITAIIRRKATPMKATWITWACLNALTSASMVARGSINGQMIGALLGTWTIAALSLKYGERGWRLIDKICFGGLLLAVASWPIFNNPTISLVMSLGATLLGGVPTYVSAWRHPEWENRVAWTIFTFACLSSTIAIPAWTLEDAAQPIVFLVNTLIVVAAILFKKPHPVAPSP